MIFDYFKFGLKNLKQRKVRSWLTMIGVFVSIAMIFVLVSVSLGLSSSVEEQFEELGSNVFFVQPKGGFSGSSGQDTILSEDDAEYIEDISGVREVTYEVVETGKINYRDETRFVSIFGSPDGFFEFFEGLSSFSLDEGEYIRRGDKNKVVVGSQHASGNIFTNEIPLSGTLEVEDEKFRVRGIMEPTGQTQTDRSVIMPIEKFREIFDSPEKIDQIYVKVEQGENVKDISERVKSKLTSFRGSDEDNRDFSITSPEDILRNINSVLNIITGFLVGVAAISLLVGAIGIANTMYTSVLERTREIGVMKATGARNKDVLSMFVIESGLLGIVGGLAGVVIGFGIGKGIEFAVSIALGTSLLSISTPAWLIAGCIIFSFGVGAFSGAIPAYQASKVKPTEALREE